MSVYAISDLHGHYDIYQKVKEILTPNDIVYCLGDCGDRGPRGFETICAVYQDPQWIYIKGNHEDMLAKALKEAYSNDYGYDTALLFNNGGHETYASFTANNDCNSLLTWSNRLDNLSCYYEYRNKDGITIFLTHAGFTPKFDTNKQPWLTNDLLWDRSHFYNPIPSDLNNFVVVHGHTPRQYLQTRISEYFNNDIDTETRILQQEKEDGPQGALWYANKHKVDIDCWTYYSKYATLLNLDTFEETIFISEE